MKHRNHFDEQGELRDIFAAVAMLGLMQQSNPPVPKWVAAQAYKYADAMLDVRDEVSHNTNNKETLINE
jgi:hypothetical protein